uniref:Uncharacterized protein n=1 Tax=Anguilla anguilla TaxID=7936 RepID=A0A0E9T9R8_ANGAN
MHTALWESPNTLKQAKYDVRFHVCCNDLLSFHPTSLTTEAYFTK